MDENLDLLGFDDVASTRPVIPDGDYHVKIVGASLEDSKDKKSKYISFDAVVQTGPHTGYRLFNGIFSLKSDKVWQFKRDTQAIDLEFPPGLTITEAAKYFVENINGFEAMVRVSSRIAQVKDDNGNYVPDPEGGRENTIKRFLSAAVA